MLSFVRDDALSPHAALGVDSPVMSWRVRAELGISPVVRAPLGVMRTSASRLVRALQLSFV